MSRHNINQIRSRLTMISSFDIRIGRVAGRGARVLLALLGLALVPAACGDLLTVEPPDLIPAEGLAVPANAKLLVNGAVGDFDCAFGAYVALTGVMSHEMLDATQTASRWPYDRRNLNPQDALYGTFGCESMGVYTPLSTARWSADFILEKLQGWTDQEVQDRQRLVAKAAAYSGYAHLLLAEGFCSVALDLSAALTPEEVMQLAVQKFGVALQAAQGAGDTNLMNFARVGRARAYLDLGQAAPALADAQAVPADFVWVATASGDFSRRANRIFAQNGEGSTGGTGLSVGEEYRNVTFNGKADPRVPVSGFVRVNTDGTDLYIQRKYKSLSDPLPIATGDEARLIVAEIQGGPQAVSIINALHAKAGLDAYSGSEAAAIAAQVIEERRRELWLEGHRFHDIRRLNLPLIPEPGTAYRKGGLYGDDRCFPMPDVEIRNNPSVH